MGQQQIAVAVTYLLQTKVAFSMQPEGDSWRIVVPSEYRNELQRVALIAGEIQIDQQGEGSG